MNVTHKFIDTGYHYVRAVGYAHLFAQWPRGTQLAYDQISHGEMPMSELTLAKFIDAAQRAADEATQS